MNAAELDAKRATLRDPYLRHDFDTLRTVECDGPSSAGFDAALRTRKALAADTQAPDWLRAYAAEVVEEVRY